MSARSRIRLAKPISPRDTALRAMPTTFFKSRYLKSSRDTSRISSAARRLAAPLMKGSGLPLSRARAAAMMQAIGERHADRPRRGNPALDDAKAREAFPHIRHLGYLRHPAPEVVVFRRPETDAIAADGLERSAAHHDGGLNKRISMSQECPQFLIAQGKGAVADDVAIGIDQVDTGTEKAELRLLFHPGMLDPQAIRKQDVSAVQARKQRRARDSWRRNSGISRRPARPCGRVGSVRPSRPIRR